jgi:hypothetical protein
MGIEQKAIKSQLKRVMENLDGPVAHRTAQRLLQKQLTDATSEEWFVAPSREYLEYLHFLYAILDDTDLLTKVSPRDVLCVGALLNRLKTLTTGEEVESVSFDDLMGDCEFAKKAADRLLANDDLYALYRKVYRAKEEIAEQNILSSVAGHSSSFFADTKMQNGCCRVGQTKLFGSNIPTFFSHVERLRRQWFEEASAIYQEQRECDLHLHMISTLAGAEELHTGQRGRYHHLDELWIWIPKTELGIQHLKSFLHAFRALPIFAAEGNQLLLFGEGREELDLLFRESFLPIERIHASDGESAQRFSIAVLRYRAGAINSRKAQISPFLPKIIA